jgi:hypothetical protein
VLFSFIKAQVTGKRPDGDEGDYGELDLGGSGSGSVNH